MKTLTDRKVNIQRRLWRHRDTGETEDLIVVWSGPHFTLIPFEVARKVCDSIHDHCDDRDRQLREAQQ